VSRPTTGLNSKRLTRLGSCAKAQPSGPYRIVGYSIGGITALEVARRIRAEGVDVFLALIDTPQNDHSWPFSVWLSFLTRRLVITVLRMLRRMVRQRRSPARLPARARPTIPSPHPPRRGTQFGYRFRNPAAPDYPQHSPYWFGEATPNYRRVGENVCRMKGFYKPSRYEGKVLFFASKRGDPLACDPEQVWPKYLPNAEWIRVPGDHVSTMFGRYAAKLAAEISARLQREAPDA
jgi:thioesterase domain-containing protein